MVVNDNAGIQDEPGALETIASKLAPTMDVLNNTRCVNDSKPCRSELARDGRQR